MRYVKLNMREVSSEGSRLISHLINLLNILIKFTDNGTVAKKNT